MRVATARPMLVYTALAIVLMEGLSCFLAAGQSHGSGNAVDGDPQSLQVPAGTILPVRLNHGFSSRSARDGQPITGRIMQDVPLPSGEKIPEGAKILGSIVSVQAAGSNGGARISFRFDRLEIHHRRSS